MLARAFLPALLLCLAALRLPSFAQPAAADQSLYIYAGQQLMAGHAPYAAAWDQKPPGIHYIYGLLWAVWPSEAVVAAVDTVVALAVAVLLVRCGRVFGGAATGIGAAGIFLLLGHPSLQRLGGIFVRGQSEVFINVFVLTSFVLALTAANRWSRFALAGAALGLAVWVKYNALAYALPLGLCLVLSNPARGRGLLLSAGAALAGLGAVGVLGLLWLGWQGALMDLWLATVEFNLQYSGDTYQGPSSVIGYVLQLPIQRARVDFLWFFGLLGMAGALAVRHARHAGLFGLAWIVASIVSIAINSARDLPQYFVQASPALAWSAAAGAAGVWRSRAAVLRMSMPLMLVLGLWRVGTDAPVAGMRLAGLPGLAGNILFDLKYVTGRISHDAYIDRFGGQRAHDKFVAREVEALARLAATTTRPDDRILVFGFSPGVYVKARRQSASRFFWSRPIVIGFAADRPGYGVDGLLHDLRQSRPALIILQKQDWGPAETNSEEFFLETPALAASLQQSYRHDADGRLYSVWRRTD